jgi:hypothetical protein
LALVDWLLVNELSVTAVVVDGTDDVVATRLVVWDRDDGFEREDRVLDLEEIPVEVRKEVAERKAVALRVDERLFVCEEDALDRVEDRDLVIEDALPEADFMLDVLEVDRDLPTEPEESDLLEEAVLVNDRTEDVGRAEP